MALGGGEDLGRRVAGDGAGDRAAAHHQADGDAPAIAAAREVRGAVDRVEHPERAGAVGRTAHLLAQDRLAGEVAREAVADEAFRRAIGFRDEVLRALEACDAAALGPHPRGEGGRFHGDGGGRVAAAGKVVHS